MGVVSGQQVEKQVFAREHRKHFIIGGRPSGAWVVDWPGNLTPRKPRTLGILGP